LLKINIVSIMIKRPILITIFDLNFSSMTMQLLSTDV
jgi:hypothetical protein